MFKEVDAFVWKCEAFVKITRLLKDIFRDMETITRLFEDILNKIEAF
jgi:hypothetical protein